MFAVVVNFTTTEAVLTVTCFAEECNFAEYVGNFDCNCTCILVFVINLDSVSRNVFTVCVSAYCEVFVKTGYKCKICIDGCVGDFFTVK